MPRLLTCFAEIQIAFGTSLNAQSWIFQLVLRILRDLACWVVCDDVAGSARSRILPISQRCRKAKARPYLIAMFAVCGSSFSCCRTGADPSSCRSKKRATRPCSFRNHWPSHRMSRISRELECTSPGVLSNLYVGIGRYLVLWFRRAHVALWSFFLSLAGIQSSRCVTDRTPLLPSRFPRPHQIRSTDTKVWINTMVQ